MKAIFTPGMQVILERVNLIFALGLYLRHWQECRASKHSAEYIKYLKMN